MVKSQKLIAFEKQAENMVVCTYSTDRVFFQKSSPAGGEWIRVERIKFWNPTASSPVPVESPRSRDESRLKFF